MSGTMRVTWAVCEARRHTWIELAVSQKYVKQWRGVQQTLESAVEETGVASVVEPTADCRPRRPVSVYGAGVHEFWEVVINF